MLYGCWWNKWPIHCMMTDEVERSFYNVRLLCSLFGQFISLVISSDVCVASNFCGW